MTRSESTSNRHNIPRGSCIICYHENNTGLRFNHSYKQCRNRDRVCRYCHQANHPVERCPYVLSENHQEPEAREPTARLIAAPRFHSVHQSPGNRAAVALGRRTLALARSRGRLVFSDDKEGSEGEFEKEPPLSSSHHPAASVAAAYRSQSNWASDLTGTVNQSNILHGSSSMGSTQNRYKPPAARRLESSPASAVPTYNAQGTRLSPFPSMNPPCSNSGAKRATATSPISASKKPRQNEQDGAAQAAQDLGEDLK